MAFQMLIITKNIKEGTLLCWVMCGGCSSSLTFALAIDKIPCRGGNTCTIFCLFHFLQPLLHCFIQTLLSQTNCRVTCNTRGCQVSSTFKPFFPFSSSFLAIIKLLLTSTSMTVRATVSFPFPYPQLYPKGRLVVAVQPHLAPGEDSTGTFSLSVLAEPEAVTAAFLDCG